MPELTSVEFVTAMKREVTAYVEPDPKKVREAWAQGSEGTASARIVVPKGSEMVVPVIFAIDPRLTDEDLTAIVGKISTAIVLPAAIGARQLVTQYDSGEVFAYQANIVPATEGDLAVQPPVKAEVVTEPLEG